MTHTHTHRDTDMRKIYENKGSKLLKKMKIKIFSNLKGQIKDEWQGGLKRSIGAQV